MYWTFYYDQEQRPQLRNSYCVFLDFLGFTDEIRVSADKGEEEAVFRRFMTEIVPLIKTLILPQAADNDRQYPRRWDAKVFSDNMIVGHVVWTEDGEAEFGRTLVPLMEFQLRAACSGYFVRGGWSLGNLFMDETTVFGTALLDAYELESKQAKFPRIILSDEMKEKVFRQMSSQAHPAHCDYLIVDDAGNLMTHYLANTISDDEIEWGAIVAHSSVIRDRLSDHASNERVLPKYKWLAAYHNFFCESLQNAPGYCVDVKIPGDLPDYGIRRLQTKDSPYHAAACNQLQ